MPGTFDGRTAFASIDFPTPGAPSFLVQSGDFSAVSIVGSAVRLDFNAPIAPSEGCARLAVRGGSGVATITDWTNSYIEVETFNLAGVATELAFDLSVLQQTTGIPVVVPPSPPAPTPPTDQLSAWWRADDAGVVNGADVTNWVDRSGGGNNLGAQAGAGFPTFASSVANMGNQPAVVFSGGQGLMQALPPGLIGGPQALSVYIVCDPLFDDSGYPGMWGFGDLAFPSVAGTVFRINPGGSPSRVMLVDCFGPNYDRYTTTQCNGQPLIMSFALGAGAALNTAEWYMNGTPAVVTGGSGSGALNSASPVQAVFMGGWSNSAPTFTWRGKIAEVLYYSKKHNGNERLETLLYLSSRYQIPLV